MENISKRFGNFYANRDINLTLNRGEVHTLLGENGAGKSTLMNILIGLYQPTDGKIFLEGKERRITSPAQAVKLGIGMVHQHFMLVEAMSVFENIILGDRNVSGIFIDKKARKKEITELSERYGLNLELDKSITEISVGAQQRVEILKALYHGAELLILDEPSAALTDIEVEGLFAIMRKLISEDKSIIFISHKMREVLHISDRITIMRAGEIVKTVPGEGADAKTLASLMIGKDFNPSQYEKKEPKDSCALSMNKVAYNKESKHNGLSQVSFELKKGEILGVAGVDGNGQTQLAQIITGVLTPQEGEVNMEDGKVAVFAPASFIEKNISHVPEDRNLQGLIGSMTVSDNLVLKSTDSPRFSSCSGWFLNKKNIKEYTQSLVEKYDIRCQGLDQEVRSLSGGNQQKVILARELESDPKVLVAVHPTRGLDVGATGFVHDKMIEARDNGVGVLLISADFDEILELSDRIVVIFEGQIMGEFSGKDPSIEEISLAMTGKVKEAGNE